MGQSLHVQSTHIIRHAGSEFLTGRDSENFTSLMDELNCTVYGLDDNGYGDRLELDVEDFVRAVTALRMMLDEPDEPYVFIEYQGYDGEIETAEYDADEVRSRIADLYHLDIDEDDVAEYVRKCLDMLQYFYDNADKSDGYIFLDWF